MKEESKGPSSWKPRSYAAFRSQQTPQVPFDALVLERLCSRPGRCCFRPRRGMITTCMADPAVNLYEISRFRFW